jgi:hypothetical protein
MISGRKNVGTDGKKLIRDVARQPKTAGGVFRVQNDKIEAKLFTQIWQLRADGIAAGTADHITDQENAHSVPFEFACIFLGHYPAESFVVLVMRQYHLLLGKSDADGQNFARMRKDCALRLIRLLSSEIGVSTANDAAKRTGPRPPSEFGSSRACSAGGRRISGTTIPVRDSSL